MWGGSSFRYFFVRNSGDEKPFALLCPLDEGIFSSISDTAYFGGPTGTMIIYRTGTAPVMSAQRFLSYFLFTQFNHWSLRWIYFGLGLAGCVLIATGYLFWL